MAQPSCTEAPQTIERERRFYDFCIDQILHSSPYDSGSQCLRNMVIQEDITLRLRFIYIYRYINQIHTQEIFFPTIILSIFQYSCNFPLFLLKYSFEFNTFSHQICRFAALYLNMWQFVAFPPNKEAFCVAFAISVRMPDFTRRQSICSGLKML